MRTWIAWGVVAGTLLAGGATANERPREDAGTILGTAPKDTAVETWLAAERCVYLTAGNDPVFDWLGHVVALHESESDGRHRFELIDADMSLWDAGAGEPIVSSDADLDVTFYSDLGSCDHALRPATPTEPPRFAGPGNEAGHIPAGMRFAVITLANSPFSSFQFSIFKP